MPRFLRHEATLFLAIALATMSAEAFAKTGAIEKERFTSGSVERVSFIYRPAALSLETKTPLLVLLHGSGRDGASLAKEWRSLADREGLLLAAPNALDSSAWAVPADGPNLLRDLVTYLSSRYPVDMTRIYLFGHSAGAVFALNMAALESEFFASIAVHAGAFRDSSDSAVLSFASRKLPVLLIVGTRDQFFPLPAVRETKQAFEAKGFPCELVELQGHDHNYYSRSDEVNRKAWAFLSPQHLEAEARFTVYPYK